MTLASGIFPLGNSSVVVDKIDSSVGVCSFLPSRWQRTKGIKFFILRCSKQILVPINESLVKLLHCSLKLTTLQLPLFIVPDRFYCWSLPCCCSCEMVNIINTSHIVNPSFPTRRQRFWSVPRSSFFNVIYIVHTPMLIHSLFPARRQRSLR